MAFSIYLCNNLCKKKYPENTSSEFSNQLIPPLIFQHSNEWEVSLKSCILPFQNYSTTYFENKKVIELLWMIKTNSIDEGPISSNYRVSIHPHQFLNKTPGNILKQIIDQSEKITGMSDIFSHILNTYANHLAITRRHEIEIKRGGIFKDVASITLILDKNAQYLFGLNAQVYNVYTVDTESYNFLINTIVGNKKITLDLVPSPYIIVYSDIVQPINFGSQNLQILDILPFGEGRLHERKLNELTYRTLSKNIIEDISISIHDSSFKILQKFSESIILCLHFRKKGIY